MKTYNYLIVAFAALALVGCSDNDFLGTGSGPEMQESRTAEITFNAGSQKLTRALSHEESASKLGNQFIVYGWKNNGWADYTTAKYADPMDVFPFYKVNYVAGSANNTESNTQDWEYVGSDTDPNYQAFTLDGSEGVAQTIKYWDYAYKNYDFIAWRSKSNNVVLANVDKAIVEAGFKGYGLQFQVPKAADAGKIYVSDQKTIDNDSKVGGESAVADGSYPAGAVKDKYGYYVELSFRNLAAKVRLGVYETIPGYSVKDVKFYKDAAGTGTTKDRANNENVSTLYANAATLPTSGDIFIKYKDKSVAANENHAVATTVTSETSSYLEFGALTVNPAVGEYKLANDGNDYIGRTSATATKSEGNDDEGLYTYVFPNTGTELNLKVDYTLVANDGSNEQIKVTGASAVVPANYTNWLMNYAYTYLFKISDNTNGSSGTPGTDPAGLYPITFDAVVVNTEEGNTQETITTVATPSITTYQNGSAITANDEYVQITSTNKNIYVTVEDSQESEAANKAAGLAVLSASNAKLYLVNTNGNEAITEHSVANYANNQITLTDISTVMQFNKKIPAAETINNVDNVFDDTKNVLAYFMPLEGYIYAFEYTQGTTKFYKVIKVQGTETRTFSFADNAVAINEGDMGTIVLEQTYNGANYKVLGAASNLSTSDANISFVSGTNAGEYNVNANNGALNGSPTITFTSKTGATPVTATKSVTVNAWEFSASAKTIAAGSTDQTITIQKNGSADATIGDKTNFKINGAAVNASVFDLDVTNGVVTLKPAATCPAGDYVITYENNSKEVAKTTITVDTYSFTSAKKAINVGGITADKTTTLTLHLGTGSEVGKSITVTTSTSDIATLTPGATNAEGQVDLTAVAKGNAIVNSVGTSITIPVYNYSVKVYTGTDSAPKGTEVTATSLNNNSTYYVELLDVSAPVNDALKATNATLTKMGTTGIFKLTTKTATPVKIQLTKNGQTFTLKEYTVVTP